MKYIWVGTGFTNAEEGKNLRPEEGGRRRLTSPDWQKAKQIHGEEARYHREKKGATEEQIPVQYTVELYLGCH